MKKYSIHILLGIITIALIYGCVQLHGLTKYADSIKLKLSTIDDRIDSNRMELQKINSSTQDVYAIIGNKITELGDDLDRRLRNLY